MHASRHSLCKKRILFSGVQCKPNCAWRLGKCYAWLFLLLTTKSRFDVKGNLTPKQDLVVKTEKVT